MSLLVTATASRVLAFTGTATVKEITGEIVASINANTREAVAVTSKDIQIQGNTISYSFPAHSFTQMLIAVR